MSPAHKDFICGWNSSTTLTSVLLYRSGFVFLSFQGWDLRVGTSSIVEARSLAHAVTSAVTEECILTPYWRGLHPIEWRHIPSLTSQDNNVRLRFARRTFDAIRRFASGGLVGGLGNTASMCFSLRLMGFGSLGLWICDREIENLKSQSFDYVLSVCELVIREYRRCNCFQFVMCVSKLWTAILLV